MRDVWRNSRRCRENPQRNFSNARWHDNPATVFAIPHMRTPSSSTVGYRGFIQAAGKQLLSPD
jgi:hypothetical protein